ncbi:MAG TPA: methyltransferase [Xanthobacteraceae bacterium]|nr:methyltransferase [Xanthobacteraceae bacterium]
MTSAARGERAYGFLCVDDFLATELDARAIKSAFETGIIDALAAQAGMAAEALAAKSRMDPVGFRLLVGLLEANDVVCRQGQNLTLTDVFRQALKFRDLLEARIDFADLVWSDIHTLFTPLLTDLPQFMARSQVFELFRYDRCIDVTAENLEATQSWLRFTTCLTKYEAAAVLDAVDFSSVQSLVDFGGNSGEFVRQICRRHPAISATIVDLPVVCALGQRHIAASATAQEAARIRFCPADFRSDPLPGPADVVSFKSVLHDWGDADAERILERADRVVGPGGRMLIFERGPIETGRRLPYAMAPNLVFLKFLRPPDLYLKKLSQLGFTLIEHRRLMLEMEFNLIVARRK